MKRYAACVFAYDDETGVTVMAVSDEAKVGDVIHEWIHDECCCYEIKGIFTTAEDASDFADKIFWEED